MSDRSNLGSNFEIRLLFDLELSKLVCRFCPSKIICFGIRHCENRILGYCGSIIYYYNREKVSVCSYIYVLYSRGAGLDGTGQALYIRNPQGPSVILEKNLSKIPIL